MALARGLLELGRDVPGKERARERRRARDDSLQALSAPEYEGEHEPAQMLSNSGHARDIAVSANIIAPRVNAP